MLHRAIYRATKDTTFYEPLTEAISETDTRAKVALAWVWNGFIPWAPSLVNQL